MSILLNSRIVPFALHSCVEELVRKHYHQPLEIEWQEDESKSVLLRLPPGLVGAMAGEWDPLGNPAPETDTAPLMAPSLEREILECVDRMVSVKGPHEA